MSKRIGIIPPASGSLRAGSWLGQFTPSPGRRAHGDQERAFSAFAAREHPTAPGDLPFHSSPRFARKAPRFGEGEIPAPFKNGGKTTTTKPPERFGAGPRAWPKRLFQDLQTLLSQRFGAPLAANPNGLGDSHSVFRFAQRTILARRPAQKPGRPGPNPWAQTAPHPAPFKLLTTGSPQRGASRGARRAAFL